MAARRKSERVEQYVSADVSIACSGLQRIRLFPVFRYTREQLWQPDQIIGGERERELSANALHAAQHGLGDWPDDEAKGSIFARPGLQRRFFSSLIDVRGSLHAPLMLRKLLPRLEV